MRLNDILIICASFSMLVADILIKKRAAKQSVFYLTGTAQVFGGVMLIVVAFILGGSLLSFNLASLGVFIYICTASMVAYILWNYILKTKDLSNMFIIKFTEPLFACIFGAILLKEDIFKWQYLIAFALICTGIILGNKKPKDSLGKKEKAK